MWETLFLTSFLINITSFFYVRWLLKYIANINEDIDALSNTILQFSTHIKSVHDLEMFYGDETLGFLMEHTKSLCTLLEDYEDAYTIAILYGIVKSHSINLSFIPMVK